MPTGKNDEVLFSAPGRNGIGDTYVGTVLVIKTPTNSPDSTIGMVPLPALKSTEPGRKAT